MVHILIYEAKKVLLREEKIKYRKGGNIWYRKREKEVVHICRKDMVQKERKERKDDVT